MWAQLLKMQIKPGRADELFDSFPEFVDFDLVTEFAPS